NRRAPSRSSSSRIARLNGGWDKCSVSAACRKLNVSATARKSARERDSKRDDIRKRYHELGHFTCLDLLLQWLTSEFRSRSWPSDISSPQAASLPSAPPPTLPLSRPGHLVETLSRGRSPYRRELRTIPAAVCTSRR